MIGSDVSVALCTFNGERFLAEQLRSIAAQTLLPKEVIVSDDGSTDSTLSMVRDFAQTVPFPVQIVSNEVTLRPAKNFEKAIGLCTGEVIALCDQDDVWMPQKLARLRETLQGLPEAAYVFSDADMIAEDGTALDGTVWEAVGLSKLLPKFIAEKQLEILLRHNLIAGCSMAFRASWKKIFLPVPSRWMHDNWMVLLGSALSTGVPVPERLYSYRRHSGQVCGWKMMSFSQVVSTSVGTDHEDLWRKVEQFREVRSRLSSLENSWPCPKSRLALLEQKETHLVKRATARSSKGISRVVDVLTEASTGRYHQFSNSWYSIIRDLR